MRLRTTLVGENERWMAKHDGLPLFTGKTVMGGKRDKALLLSFLNLGRFDYWCRFREFRLFSGS